MTRTIKITTAALALSFAAATFAEAGPLRHRHNRQKARITQGVESGSLTQGEKKVLQAEQATVRARRRAALADDGRIGPKEARNITRAQNRASRHIHRAKHNDRTAD